LDHFLTTHFNKLKRVILLAFLIPLPAISSDTKIEDDQLTDIYSYSLEDLLKIKIDIANRYPTELIKVPSSVTVFTADQLQKSGVKTLEQLLTLVPGIQVARGEEGPGTYAVSMRGRRSDAGSNRDLLVLLDGLRLNEPMTSGAMSQERQLALFNVERVEIIRGPSSALYGANAFLGVINIISKNNQNEVSISAGSFNANEMTFSAAQDYDNWSWTLSSRFYEDEGEHYEGFYEYWGYLEDTQDPTRQVDFNLKLDSKSGLSAIFRQSEREHEDFIALGGQLNDLQKQIHINKSLQLKYSFQVAEQRISLYAEKQKGVSDFRTGLFPYNPQPTIDPNLGLYWTDGSLDAFVGGNYRTVKQKRAGLDVHWQINQVNQLAYGLLLRNESSSLNPFQGNWDVDILESTGALLPAPVDDFIQRGFYIGGIRFDLLQPESRDIKGIYVQSESELSPLWSLTIGLRNDHYEDFGGNTSLRTGLVYNDAPYFFKILFGEAFRAPSFVETRAGIASGGIANPDLMPEIVRTSELVWGTHHQEWNVTVTWYNNQFSNIILPVLVDNVVPGITAFQPQNSGDESNSGMELELNYQFDESWKFSLGGDYLLKELDLHPVATQRFFSSLSYEMNTFYFNIRSRYLGEIIARKATDVTNQVTLDSYWLTDINLRWNAFKSTTLVLNASNLFNQQNQSYNPQAGIEQGLPGRGRHLMFGLEYRW